MNRRLEWIDLMLHDDSGMDFEGRVLYYDVSSLPDVLLQHTLVTDSRAERMREYWRRWTSLLATFHDIKDGAYQLQINWQPKMGRIAVRLFFKSPFLPFVEFAASSLRDLGLRGEIETMTQSAFSALFSGHSSTVEIRQAMRQTECDDQPLDIVMPWWGPDDEFRTVFDTLIHCESDVTVNWLLISCNGKPEEYERVWEMTRSLATEANKSKGRSAVRNDFEAGNSIDPVAAWHADMMSERAARIQQCPLFLLQGHVMADDAQVAENIARVIQTSIAQQVCTDSENGKTVRLRSSAQYFVYTQEQVDMARCRLPMFEIVNTCAEVATECGGEYGAPVGSGASTKNRLPYLVDARGAATVFRPPASVNSGLAGIPVRQAWPGFHPGPILWEAPEGFLELGKYPQGDAALVPLDDLRKHILVVGFTGSGKSVTILNILHQLNEASVPFLVLEPAKKEYRGLLGVWRLREQMLGERQELHIFTVGDELHAPLRLNPFELLPGVRVETHISRLQTCFEGALPPIGPLASLIYEALLMVYRDQKWMLTDVGPEANEFAWRRFPTMQDFVACIETALDKREYGGDVETNVRAAVTGRLKPMTMGSRGRIFEGSGNLRVGELVTKSSLVTLFETPTVIELNDLNLDDKALIAMFILTFLREYRERAMARGDEHVLRHVTVVEEAHNILENISSSGNAEGSAANMRFKVVETFCNMLTEMRALGEGLIIADQSPQKLARDAIRNTNVQIAHQLRDAQDRKVVADAMSMGGEQRDFLGKLPPGSAALFVTGLERATFVSFPPYTPSREDEEKRPKLDAGREAWIAWLKEFAGDGFGDVQDEEVADHMHAITVLYKRLDLPFPQCNFCPDRSTCPHRPLAMAWKPTQTDVLVIRLLSAEADPGGQGGTQANAETVAEWACRTVLAQPGINASSRPGAAYCTVLCGWDYMIEHSEAGQRECGPTGRWPSDRFFDLLSNQLRVWNREES